MIYTISPDMLHERFLREQIYPNFELTHYWSTRWEVAFYIDLARAGFISIAHEHPELGSILLPEIQAGYAVLDWPNLHRSDHIRRLIRSGRLEDDAIELCISDASERVIARILDYHKPRTWLTPAYRSLLAALPSGDDRRFGLHAVELWSRRENRLIAGELGYTIGRTYTSLSGFTTRKEPRWRNFGTLQMVLLAERLQACDYAFWNMGHTKQPYKRAVGAQILLRGEFLERWTEARDQLPNTHLSGFSDR